MLEAEKLAIRIKKKLKRNDLDFTVQVSLSSNDPGKIYYATQITPVAEGIAPMTFIAPNGDELIAKLKDALDNKLDPEQVEKAYHESQIHHANRTIKFHEERIKEIEEPEEEEQAETKEEE